MAKYRFVYKNGGWWLKISTIEELNDYLECIESPIARGTKNAINSKEFTGNPADPHADAAGLMVLLRIENAETGLLQAACSLAVQADRAKVEALKKGNDLYFNRSGGWHYGKHDYTQWYDSEKLIFPDFHKSQIKVERFPAGKHFYAYIDNMQVRDGDMLKWNTYDEAYKKALQFVNSEE